MHLKFRSDLVYMIAFIDRAKTFTGTDRGEVDSMIASLETSRVQSEKDAEQTHEVLLETENLKRELEEKLS